MLQIIDVMVTSIIRYLFGINRFYWLLCTIGLAPQFILAQYRADIQEKMDILHRTLPVIDRIDYMNEISEYLFNAYADSLSLYYAEQAYQLSGTNKYVKGLADASYNLAGLKRVSGQYQESLDLYMLALKTFEAMEAEDRQYQTLFNMGKLYYSMKQPELAKNHIQKATSIMLALCESKPDSICAGVFSLQGWVQFKENDFKEARISYRRAIEYCIQSGCKGALYSSYLQLGLIDLMESHYEASLVNYHKAIQLFESSQYISQLYEREGQKLYYNVGYLYLQLGNRVQSIQFWEKAEHLCPEDFSFNEVAGGHVETTLFLEIASSYLELDMAGQAQVYINKALAAAKKRGDDKIVARGHHLMAGLFVELEYNELALEQYKMAASVYEKTDQSLFLGNTLYNIGRVQFKLNQKEEAIHTLKQAQLFASRSGNFNLIHMSLAFRLAAGDTSVTYQQLIDLCLTELERGDTLVNEIDLKHIYSSILEGYFAMHDYERAEPFAYKLLAQATKWNDQDIKLTAYEYLTEISEHLGKNELAISYLEKAYHLKDTIQEKKNRRVIAEIQFRNESALQKEEIGKLNRERENTNLILSIQEERLHSMTLEQERAHFRNLYQLQQLDLMANQQELNICEVENNQAHIKVQAGEMRQKEDQLRLMEKESEVQQLALRRQKAMKNISFAGLGVFGLMFLLVRKNYITSQKLKLQTVRNKIAADLHDEVGGTLSSIQLFSEIAKQQSTEVIPMLDTINDSAKKMLDAMTDIVWTINPENDDVEKILDRMRSFAFELLSAKKIEFEFNADEELHELKLPMEVRRNVYLIFKESTNNLVKYANASRVHFSINEENRNLTMRIQDNGKGFDTEQATKGNGLKNMKKRAEEIGAHLRIESKQNEGTTITLRLAV